MTMDARPPFAGYWMPTKPMGTIAALMGAGAVTAVAGVLLAQFWWSPLQRFYLRTYVKSTLGAALEMRDKPYTQMLMHAKGDSTVSYFASVDDVAFVDDAAGQPVPVLTATARQDGMTSVSAHTSRIAQTRMRELLARHVYQGRGVLELVRVPLLTGAGALVVFLIWGIRLDVRRAGERRRGARLRGTEIVSAAEFTARVAEES
jgi:hypothetical protein